MCVLAAMLARFVIEVMRLCVLAAILARFVIEVRCLCVHAAMFTISRGCCRVCLVVFGKTIALIPIV